jgi:hypothetical protein
MIDAEVIRLRGLRNTLLRARAIAQVLNSNSERPNSAFARGALDCWRIARAITGKLRAHPYLAYQRGPTALDAVYNHVAAKLAVGLARRRGRTWRRFALELQRVSRELDDVRAITWCNELSDTLGRSQIHIRRLIVEVEYAAQREAGSVREPASIDAALVAPRPRGASAGASQWPYLAI